MTRALQAVTSGRMGVNRAALEFNVPCTTLKDRVARRITHGCNMGPKTYLTREEEKELADFLISCAKIGFAKTRQDVMNLVHRAVLKKEEKQTSKVSHGWWMHFCKRWPELILRKGDSFPIVRDQETNYTVFKNYFDLLGETLIKYGIKDKSAQIYNYCD